MRRGSEGGDGSFRVRGLYQPRRRRTGLPHSPFDDEARGLLASADLIVLSGGDSIRGWRIREQTGIQEAITRRYFEEEGGKDD